MIYDGRIVVGGNVPPGDLLLLLTAWTSFSVLDHLFDGCSIPLLRSMDWRCRNHFVSFPIDRWPERGGGVPSQPCQRSCSRPLHHLGAHVLKMILEFDFLCHGHTIFVTRGNKGFLQTTFLPWAQVTFTASARMFTPPGSPFLLLDRTSTL